MEKYNELFYQISSVFNMNPMLRQGAMKISLKVSPDVFQKFKTDLNDHIISQGYNVINGQDMSLEYSKSLTYCFNGQWEIELTTE